MDERDEVQVEEKHSDQPARVIQSGDLFNGANRLIIEHEGSRYILRITRSRKLLLQK